MHAVDILVGVHRQQRGVVVDLRRRGVLREERVDIVGGVELADRGEEVVLGGVFGEMDVGRFPAQLFGLRHLHADVADTG